MVELKRALPNIRAVISHFSCQCANMDTKNYLSAPNREHHAADQFMMHIKKKSSEDRIQPSVTRPLPRQQRITAATRRAEPEATDRWIQK